MIRKPHNQPGHVNAFVRDHDSVITGHGAHDRVIATLPSHEGLYARVDHKWNLGAPSAAQVIAVAEKDQGVKGKWVLSRTEKWADGSSTDFFFVSDGV